MSTLTIIKSDCINNDYHTPHMESISLVEDTRYTFCEVCENNIDSFYIDDDYDRLPFWTKWSITR